MANSLKGKTLFITGASRGIGKAIALRAARDGANIVVAAKTVEPDPRLPGTIHTAAAEIEAAGGQALAVALDIRDADQILSAVERAAVHFGGIDVLINNASAIYTLGTLATPVKRYDLMMNINVRGSFLCAQACLQHLLKARNPHILALSPPIDLQPKWFATHPAYTASKFGMSMIALGLAAEFRGQGVASNGLWPRTLIGTSALKIAAPAASDRSRVPAIMADAAHWILTQPSRTFSGNFCLDELVLRNLGVVDFEQYSVSPGVEPDIDYFIDP